MLKVDLGGVGRNSDGWLTVNINHSLRRAPDLVADIRRLPFKAGSLDAIRCIHTLEHLYACEMAHTLRRWYECLKPGGKLYLVVPDLGRLAREYAAGRIPFELFASVAYVPGSREHNAYEKHRWGWDQRTLYLALEAVGFEDIRVWTGYPPAWILDYEELIPTGLVGHYLVPNLCMEAKR